MRTSAWGTYVNQLHRGVDCRETCLLIAGTPVAVTAGTLQAAVDFRLVATGSIAGRVTDSASSRAVQSAQVEVLDEGEKRVDSTSTDAAGSFALGRLAPGLYYLRVRGPEGYASELYDGIPCRNLIAPRCSIPPSWCRQRPRAVWTCRWTLSVRSAGG